jgi:hypothetical protein
MPDVHERYILVAHRPSLFRGQPGRYEPYRFLRCIPVRRFRPPMGKTAGDRCDAEFRAGTRPHSVSRLGKEKGSPSVLNEFGSLVGKRAAPLTNRSSAAPFAAITPSAQETRCGVPWQAGQRSAVPRPAPTRSPIYAMKMSGYRSFSDTDRTDFAGSQPVLRHHSLHNRRAVEGTSTSIFRRYVNPNALGCGLVTLPGPGNIGLEPVEPSRCRYRCSVLVPEFAVMRAQFRCD